MPRRNEPGEPSDANGSSLLAAGEQRSLDRIQHQVEMFAHILREEAQHEVAVLLEQLILATIAAVRIDAFQVLPTVQFDQAGARIKDGEWFKDHRLVR
jgi:hypothetical protein